MGQDPPGVLQGAFWSGMPGMAQGSQRHEPRHLTSALQLSLALTLSRLETHMGLEQGTQGGNCYSQRKQDFQTSLVETTSDLKALASDLQQVETVSFQPVGPSVRGFLASTLSSLDKYYHFAEDHSDKHDTLLFQSLQPLVTGRGGTEWSVGCRPNGQTLMCNCAVLGARRLRGPIERKRQA
ncbi:hypothetical protein NQZ68_027266 [Dissostichus eleginoides]|nr:hypothetical protein NQZ68_027266 [Dissostichus eleginoides]